MGEREETSARDAWQVGDSCMMVKKTPHRPCAGQAKRDAEAVKLRNELEARISTLEGYAERMDTKFGGSFTPGEDGE